MSSIPPAKRPAACPSLGALHDSSTLHDFPSPGNYCHRLQPPVRPTNLHQEGFCLSGRQAQCPIFVSGEAITAEEKRALRPAPARAGLFTRTVGVWALVGVALIGIGVWLALSNRRPAVPPPTFAPTPSVLPAVMAASATPSPTSTLAPTPTRWPTALPTATPLPSATPTRRPTRRPTRQPPATQAPSPTPEAGARLANALGVNVRRGPSLYYPILGRLTDPALELRVVGRDAPGRWWQVCCGLPEGEAGWVSAESVTLTGAIDLVPVVAEPPSPFVTTTAYVNLRDGPGIDYPLAQLIPPGRQLGIIGRTAASDWWQVCCWGGQPGWLSQVVTVLSGDATSVPVSAGFPPLP